MIGIFGLYSDKELIEKLKWEYANLKNDFSNSYIAYNFFVTAWHLLEWKYPEDVDERKTIHDDEVILQICEHIAIGAKHFKPTKKSLNSVKETKKRDAWAESAWAKGAWSKKSWSTKLEINLSGKAAEEYGEIISVEKFSEIVMNYWKSYEDKNT